MAFGTKRMRGENEYVFVDGRMLKADEVIRIEVDSPVAAPGQNAAPVPGQGPIQEGRLRQRLSNREALRKLDQSDAFEVREEFLDELVSRERTESLMADDRRKMRRKIIGFGLVLLALVLFALCKSEGYYMKFYSPADVLTCYGQWFRLQFIHLFHSEAFAAERLEVMTTYTMYLDVLAQLGVVWRYLMCGSMLALSGMLYQNAFRNPIAAPSMLGISNGMSMATLVMVLLFNEAAISMKQFYFLFSYGSGIAVLLLVLAGGKWMSGKHEFNVVNMLLMGTVISQLLGVLMTFIQNYFMTEAQWLVFYEMSEAMTDLGIWHYVSIVFGLCVSLVPVWVFRFRLNLISFSDQETKLLGVDPNKLRVLALSCGSLMILTAQVNAGQISVVSLVIPFIARYVFGSEFRKQMVGNVILGMFVLLLCHLIQTCIWLNWIEISLSSVVTIMAMPLFIWMMVVRQRTWEN